MVDRDYWDAGCAGAGVCAGAEGLTGDDVGLGIVCDDGCAGGVDAAAFVEDCADAAGGLAGVVGGLVAGAVAGLAGDAAGFTGVTAGLAAAAAGLAAGGGEPTVI